MECESNSSKTFQNAFQILVDKEQNIIQTWSTLITTCEGEDNFTIVQEISQFGKHSLNVCGLFPPFVKSQLS
jgi:hypothetical protein